MKLDFIAAKTVKQFLNSVKVVGTTLFIVHKVVPPSIMLVVDAVTIDIGAIVIAVNDVAKKTVCVLMNKYLIALLIVLLTSFAQAEEYAFHGSWEASNRPINGPMSCEFKSLGNYKYEARFYGIWQGVPFDYPVKFTGTPVKQGDKIIKISLKGTATVDFVPYTWTGFADAENLTGTYTSHRYVGSFAMKGAKKVKK